MSGALLIAIIILSAFLLVRNELVFIIAGEFIEDDALYPAYDKLPSYFHMVFNPIYWGLWTKQQWVKWLSWESETAHKGE